MAQDLREQITTEIVTGLSHSMNLRWSNHGTAGTGAAQRDGDQTNDYGARHGQVNAPSLTALVRLTTVLRPDDR